ncbi:hypothetical protein LSH36_1g12000 [Paralvinella palmiformis]|uniref:Uncharacterized protein n=1 Tax=Paralvinella palmiformis TaxID=53620 RepID=A0AAD9KGA1_9ANNE|nr:hypothetical protein LSH36_1g12000 [Paralvinella palmiformis]
MGGFGESTDTMTLKKKSNKKRRGSKKTDTNHNRKGSLGTNSTGHHSPESTTGPKGSIKSKSSITSKASIKSKSSNSNMNGMVERRLSLAGHGISAGITLPKGTAVLFSELKAKEDDDDLLDSNNVHLFAYDNPAVSNSATSLSSLHCSSTILPPPPEFQDDKVKGSPFNTSDRGHIEDPPTAIVRPSVKQPPAKVILNQREPNNSVHIPMQDFAHSCTNTFQREDCRSDLTASAAGMDPTMAPSSFLWSLNDKTFVS